MNPEHRAHMRRLILGAIGATSVSASAAGCGGIAILDDGSGGFAGTSASGGKTTGTGSKTSSTTKAATTTESGPTFAAPTSGVTTGGTCPILSSEIIMPPEEGPCAGIGSDAMRICFQLPGGDPPSCSLLTPECILDAYSCGFSDKGIAYCPDDGIPEGPCCYTVVGDCPVGRPFVVGGRARLATLGAEATWSSALSPDVTSLDAATRDALADYWAREGLAEHASVASFARFVLQLLAVAAPADLVSMAQRAIGDELSHARTSFGLASAYAGHTLGPSALDVSRGLDGSLDPIAIAVSVAEEGCVAETVAALQMVAAADAASDPAVKAALTRMAEQEVEHALLAWRYLGHAVAQGDRALREAVAAVFARAADHVGFGPTTALPADEARLRAHGYLSVAERRALAHASLSAVVMPCAAALLAEPTRARIDGVTAVTDEVQA